MILRLGKVDKGQMPTNRAEFLAPYHISMAPMLKEKLKFRDEALGKWRNFLEVEGKQIAQLQQFLKDSGFMPKANVDGIFGYATTAAVRLFQEYVRTIEGKKDIGIPDGVVGKNTLKYIQEWKDTKEGTENYVCEWGKASSLQPSQNYQHWLRLLAKGQQHYQNNKHQILEHIEHFAQPTDTQKIENWDTSANSIHLIGIRRNQEKASSDRRENDDLFVLLIKGMVFYFWGSTDPNPGMAQRSDIPFLVEGQHKYGFGWHKIHSYNKIYKALRPAEHGVLVYRDKDYNQALTDFDVIHGLDPHPNQTINIHWSGIGRTNFSAGCQVLAGASYINHQDKLIDCRFFAAPSYAALGTKTRGAYNVLADLILTYAPSNVRTLTYTLTRDDMAFLSDELTVGVIREVVGRLKKKH